MMMSSLKYSHLQRIFQSNRRHDRFKDSNEYRTPSLFNNPAIREPVTLVTYHWSQSHLDPHKDYSLFGFTLSENAKSRWLDVTKKANTAAAALGGTIYLDQVITDFIAEYCDEDACDSQLAYVHNVRKPFDSMNDRDFQMNLENCNNIADWMPGSSPILTEDELKRVFVLAMPK